MTRLNSLSLSALLLAILLPHLLLINYSLLSFEIGFFVLASITVGFAVGSVVRNKYLFGFVLGFCIYFFLDAYFFDVQHADTLFVLCVFGVPLLMRYGQNTIQLAVLAFSVVFTVPTLFDSPEPTLLERPAQAEPGNTDPKPEVAYIHLILDEQMSPLVFKDQMPSDYSAADFFASYLENAFMVYGIANSNDSRTIQSVSATFGLTDELNNYVRAAPQTGHSFEVKENRLIDRLTTLGFSTTVVESSHLRLCGDSVTVSCQTYSRVSNMQAIQSLDLSLGRRLELAVLSLYEDYVFNAKPVMFVQVISIRLSKARYGKLPTSYGYFARSIVNLDILEDVATQAATIAPGEAIIAHVLLPHLPYVLDRDCDLRRPAQWGYPLRQDNSVNLDKTYATFWDQAICTGNRIADIMEQVKDRDDVVFVVHGDHGGRIFQGTEDESDIDNLGTFLAIKSPVLDGGLLIEPVSLQNTFAREFDNALRVAP